MTMGLPLPSATTVFGTSMVCCLTLTWIVFRPQFGMKYRPGLVRILESFLDRKERTDGTSEQDDLFLLRMNHDPTGEKGDGEEQNRQYEGKQVSHEVFYDIPIFR